MSYKEFLDSILSIMSRQHCRPRPLSVDDFLSLRLDQRQNHVHAKGIQGHNKKMRQWIVLCLFIAYGLPALATINADKPVAQLIAESKAEKEKSRTLKDKLKSVTLHSRSAHSESLIFDIPVTYNKKVSQWIQYYQTRGNRWFRAWLQRSTKYLPFLQKELRREGLPTDLAFMVMVESGFSPNALSTAEAVGPWQFIAPTGARYGLNKKWWLDERKDFKKSTLAAARYLRDLYSEFGSWYLVAASYNMGENGLRRQIQKHGTNDFWALSKVNAIPAETQEYVPKILAAMLITKAPNLYGFRDIEAMEPFEYETVSVPGGTDLDQVADAIGVTRKSLKDLNAELILGYIPQQVDEHRIRVPKGAGIVVLKYLQNKNQKVAWE